MLELVDVDEASELLIEVEASLDVAADSVSVTLDWMLETEPVTADNVWLGRASVIGPMADDSPVKVAAVAHGPFELPEADKEASQLEAALLIELPCRCTRMADTRSGRCIRSGRQGKKSHQHLGCLHVCLLVGLMRLTAATRQHARRPKRKGRRVARILWEVLRSRERGWCKMRA